MKHFFYFVIILCGVCGISSCHRSPFAEYRMEKVDSIRISKHVPYYENPENTYVCIKNQDKIDSLCDIIYYSTTKEVAKFYPKMDIVIYGGNQKQVFGVSGEFLKGEFCAKSKYNLEEILKDMIPDTLSDTSQIDDTDIFDFVNCPPSFPGGQQALLDFLRENTKYPEQAEKDSIVGRVVISFVVETDGSITNTKVVRSVHPLLDAEALRVTNLMPKWEPGNQNGIPVRVKYNIPVIFKLE